MEITEVRIKLITGKNDKLRAFCSITIDNDFVIRDLKVIEGARGPFVAMPSRKLMERCGSCKGKNHQRAKFCNECGRRLPPARNGRDARGAKVHADIAHPINSGCRGILQSRVLEYYAEEVEKAKRPDYRPADMEVFDEEALVEESSVLADLGHEELAAAGGSEGSETGTAMKKTGLTETGLTHTGLTNTGLVEEVRQPGISRGALVEKQRPWEEVPGEPEDNFGAGLFS